MIAKKITSRATPAAPRKPSRRPSRRPSTATKVAKTVVEMPLGDLARFAEALVRADLEVAQFVLDKLNDAVPTPKPPSTGAHGSGALRLPDTTQP